MTPPPPLQGMDMSDMHWGYLFSARFQTFCGGLSGFNSWGHKHGAIMINTCGWFWTHVYGKSFWKIMLTLMSSGLRGSKRVACFCQHICKCGILWPVCSPLYKIKSTVLLLLLFCRWTPDIFWDPIFFKKEENLIENNTGLWVKAKCVLHHWKFQYMCTAGFSFPRDISVI